MDIRRIFAGLTRYGARPAVRPPPPVFEPYVDSRGLPHGSPGDKLLRLAARRRLGVNPVR